MRQSRRSLRVTSLWVAFAGVVASGVCHADVGGGGSGGITTTTSTTHGNTYTPLSETERVDEFLTRVTARLSIGGGLVYDQSFALPFGAPTVQAALLDAAAALENAAAPAGVTIGGPQLIAEDTTFEGETVATLETLDHTETSVTTTTSIGPATILIGEDQAETYFVEAGTININTNTHTQSFIFRTETTTRHFLTESLYEIVGTPVVVPPSSGCRKKLCFENVEVCVKAGNLARVELGKCSYQGDPSRTDASGYASFRLRSACRGCCPRVKLKTTVNPQTNTGRATLQFPGCAGKSTRVYRGCFDCRR